MATQSATRARPLASAWTLGGGSATLTGNATWAEGAPDLGGGVSLPDIDSAVRLDAALLDDREAFTLGLYVRTTDPDGAALVSGARPGQGNELLAYLADDTLTVYVKGVGEPVPTPTLADGAWHHLALVREASGVVTVYVDHEVAGAMGLPQGPLDLDPDGLWLGLEQDEVGAAGQPEQNMTGDLDHLVIVDGPVWQPDTPQLSATTFVGDGLGDVCDPCPATPAPACLPLACLDTDGDGFGPPGASDCPGGAARFDCDDADPARNPDANDSCGDDVDGDCDGVTDEGCGSWVETTWTSTYDADDRLTSRTGPDGTTTWTYDAYGNRATEQGPTPESLTTFTWDARDLLTTLERPASTTHFTYDADRARVGIDDPTGSRRLLLDGSHPLATYDADQARLQRYEREPNRLDAWLSQSGPSGKRFYTKDALGSVHGLTDPAGQLTSSYAYDVFGAREATLGADEAAFGWQGRPHVADSSLTYHRYRYFDTAGAQWLAPDPLFTSARTVDGPSASLRQTMLGAGVVSNVQTEANPYAWPGQQPSGLTDGWGLSGTFRGLSADEWMVVEIMAFFASIIIVVAQWHPTRFSVVGMTVLILLVKMLASIGQGNYLKAVVLVALIVGAVWFGVLSKDSFAEDLFFVEVVAIGLGILSFSLPLLADWIALFGGPPDASKEFDDAWHAAETVCDEED